METLPEDGELLRQIVGHIPEVIWVTDPEKNRMLYVSPGYEKIWGRTVESLYKSPRGWVEAIHPEDRDRLLDAALTKQVSGEYNEEYRVVRPDGSIRWIHDRAFPIRNEAGLIYRIVGIAVDITERKQLVISLRNSESQFSSLIGITADAVIMMDEAHRITLFNKGAERIFGYQAAEVIGRPLDRLLPGRFVEAHHGHVRAFKAGTERARLMGERGCVISGRRKNGEEFPAEASISKLDRNGQTLYAAILRDITERRQAEEMVQRVAFYDTLTGLPNRNMLYDRLMNTIRTDNGEGKPIALLLMDLDHFKEVNDTLGHHRGDVLLQQVGTRLKEALRPTDMVARLGGDEFAVMIPLAGSKDAALVADKILKALEPPFMIEGLPIIMEASIGLSLYPDHGGNPDSLMQRADVAMYAAKKTGEGCIIYETKHDLHSPRRLALMGELRQAIGQDQLFLHYQPKIDLRTHRVIGVEALARWQHPEHGFIPPDQFIPPAERTGLIKPLTLWIFNTAQKQCLAWNRPGHELDVSINLSARNLHDRELPDHLQALLQDCGGNPDRLELEITESAIMADPIRALEAIKRLRAMGLRFAIDDFGIGYSSLANLKKLPVTTIKIDKSFVINMSRDENDAVIVRSTIDLARNLGLKVVAEGVENKETYNRLVEWGCDAAQGYYMCRPISADEFTRWLRESPFVPPLSD
jgi:diguanylate cyclase (GGDEF)-like protein/PAS domain S-box-containing protein